MRKTFAILKISKMFLQLWTSNNSIHAMQAPVTGAVLEQNVSDYLISCSEKTL